MYLEAVDLTTRHWPDITNQVAYIATQIAKEIGMSPQNIENIAISSMLHDIGGLSLADRLATLKFNWEAEGIHEKIAASSSSLSLS
jgi:response regulator RpfG family c-di-GMP phosphodiesterase